jgi:hypothetical protein
MSLLPELLSALLFITVVLVLLLRRKRGAGDAASAQQALHACEHLLMLAAHLQQHRGMSSAWLAGDKNFGPRLSSKRRDIEHLFHPLHDAAQSECNQTTPCLTVNELSVFRFKWRSLVDALPSLTPEKSIAEHSQLIATVLDWLDALGEARVGLAMGRQLPLGLVKNYVHRLPALTECLGQARALGSSVAARGQCPAVARVRLMFLVTRAESLLDQACQADELGTRSSEARRMVQALAELIRTRMLAQEGVRDITADSYFTQATGAIDGVFAWIRDCGHNLEQRLNDGTTASLGLGLQRS